MAKIRAMIGSGGGSATVTDLWVNPDTSTGVGADTVVTLSDNIINYDLLKFVYKCKVADADSTAMATYVSPTDLIATGDYSSSGNELNKFTIGARSGSSGGSNYCRMVVAPTNTSIKFQRASKTNTSGLSDNIAIPIKIVGLKGINF